MQVFLNKERIGNLTKTGNTTVRLSPSVITLGAKQYSTGNLTCDITLSGAGGIDSGSVQASKAYYLYAVVDSGTVKLIASLSGTQPLGFSTNKKIGGLFTNGSSQVLTVSRDGMENVAAFKKVNEEKFQSTSNPMKGLLADFWDSTSSYTFDISLIPLTNSQLLEWNDTTQTRLVAKEDIYISVSIMATVAAGNTVAIYNKLGEGIVYEYINTGAYVNATSPKFFLKQGDYIYFWLSSGIDRLGSIIIDAERANPLVINN